ncbi:MAG: twin transmembrane helix small protein [Pseudomonadota bacterium]|nr:twin transmembrane helix small protein [Pseudomonadota bacterium]
MRYVVFLFIALILYTLGRALYFVMHDRGASERSVRALTYRVILSITLFALLMLGYRFGYLSPQGL